MTLARLHVVPWLGGFLEMHPQISIDAVLDDRNVDLLEGGIDIAPRMGALSDSSMTAPCVAQGPRAVIGTPAYFATHGVLLEPEALAGRPAVIYSHLGGDSASGFQREDRRVSVDPTSRIRMSAAEGVRAAVLADLGLVMASEWMFGPERASGQVIRVLTNWTLPRVDLWAAFPTGRMVGAKARAFMDVVEAMLAT